MRLPLFVEREELFAAWAPLQAAAGGAPDVAAVLALCRVYGAALGLSTAIGKASKADYTARKNDPIAYGGDVYSFLRENGANQPDIIRAALPILEEIAERLWPREEEVAAAAVPSAPLAE